MQFQVQIHHSTRTNQNRTVCSQPNIESERKNANFFHKRLTSEAYPQHMEYNSAIETWSFIFLEQGNTLLDFCKFSMSSKGPPNLPSEVRYHNSSKNIILFFEPNAWFSGWTEQFIREATIKADFRNCGATIFGVYLSAESAIWTNTIVQKCTRENGEKWMIYWFINI